MASMVAYVLVPLIGYMGLWAMGIALFLAYFRLFRIRVDVRRPAAMIDELPPYLAIATVPVCSFISFFVTAKAIVHLFGLPPGAAMLWIALDALSATVILDALITVGLEKVDIRSFPLSLMYALAWIVIVPAVMLA